MKIFHIFRKEPCDYDEHQGFVVAAATLDIAMAVIGRTVPAFEQPHWDLASGNVGYETVGTAARGIKTGVILRDFHAG